jgi:hypothetical protein
MFAFYTGGHGELLYCGVLISMPRIAVPLLRPLATGYYDVSGCLGSSSFEFLALTTYKGHLRRLI